ncbi:MAG: hypothetical protein QOI73_936 [Solirubrobacteraceae bacterium]|nr:hypothetical protein [Solirubrobacteraceae bacterium]
MPLKNYGVLRAAIVDHRVAADANAHFQLHAVAGATHMRIAVNVASQMQPSELEYVIDSDYRHPILAELAALPAGWNALESRGGGVALDFIRANLFDREALRPLPFDVPGPDNDLNEKLALYVRRAIADEQATAYAFGERWGPEDGLADKIFGFEPGGGVHDIHMNQSNVGRFREDDGVWQDGALLLHFPAAEQWVAIFLTFQSQGWHTDDATGHALAQPGDPPDGAVRIVAALVNAVQSPETEFVTLLNTTAAAIDLAGWRLADRAAHTMALDGTIAAGETLRVQLTPQVALPNGGGSITLLDAAGLKVDGVAYTGERAAEPGRTLAF